MVAVSGPFLALQNGDSLRLEPAGSSALLRYADGAALLTTLPGWWDTNNYVAASSLWANQGSLGSLLDASVGPTNKPAFTNGTFVMDGVNDFVGGPTNAVLNPAGSFSFGCLIKPLATLANGIRIMAKDHGSGQTWMLRGGVGVMLANINDGTTSAISNTTLPTVGKWQAITCVRDVANMTLTVYTNGTPNTPAVLTSSGSVTSAAGLAWGNGGSTYLNMDFRASWYTPTALTQAQVATIAAYYGV